MKIKISIPGQPLKIQADQFINYEKLKSENIVLGINDPDLTEADYWFVIEDVFGKLERCAVAAENIYFLTAEVVHPPAYYDTKTMSCFLDQFGAIISCHDIYRKNSINAIPFLPWMINANHGCSVFASHQRDRKFLLECIPKKIHNKFSVFCSTQTSTADHKLRLKFVIALKKYYGDRLDWYGNGINPLMEKWDGIAPYKYHLVLENQSRNNVITEKIFDSYIGLAYPIYYGSPNIEEYFDKQSFVKIDAYDINKSITVINSILDSDRYDANFDLLLKQREIVLNDYNVFERIIKIAKNSSIKNRKPLIKQRELKSSREIFRQNRTTRDWLLDSTRSIVQRTLNTIDRKQFANIINS